MTWFHRHQWVTIEMEHGVRSRAGDMTMLLQQCECGDIRVKELDGLWSPKALGLPDDVLLREHP